MAQLPGIPTGGVQTLGRRDIGAEISAAAAPAEAVGQILGAGAKAYEHMQILEEQEEALSIYKTQVDKRSAVISAMNAESGKVDINRLPPEVRASYLGNVDYDQSRDEVITPEGGQQQRWVDFHRVGKDLTQMLIDDENEARGRIKTNRQMAMYEGHDREAAQRFADGLRASQEASVIQATVDKGLDIATTQALDGDVSGLLHTVNDTLSPYMKESRKKTIKNSLFKTANSVITNRLNDITERVGDAQFNGETDAVAAMERSWNDQMADANSYAGLFDDKQTEALKTNFKYTKYLQGELGEMEAIFDEGRGVAAAEKYVREHERVSTAKTGLPQELQDKTQDQLITRFHRLKFQDSARRGAAETQVNADVKNYVSLVSGGGDAKESDADDLRVRVSQSKNSEKLSQAMDNADNTKELSLMPASERNQILSKKFAQGTAVPLKDVPEMQMAQRMQGQMAKDIASRPLELFVQQGFANESVLNFDMNDPVTSYIANAEVAAQASAHYGTPVGTLPRGMAKDIATRFNDNDMSQAEARAHLSGIVALGPEQGMATAEQIFRGGAPAMAAAANVALEGGDPTNILRGRDMLAATPALVPKKSSRGKDFNQELVSKGVYQAYSASPAFQSAMAEAIQYEYAALTRGIPKDTIDHSLVKEAITNVTGGLVRAGDNKIYTQAPFRGASQDVWADGIKRLDAKTIKLMGEPALPMEEAMEVIKEQGQPIALGNGRYQFRVFSAISGEPRILKDKFGQPWILDWSQIPGARQAVR